MTTTVLMMAMYGLEIVEVGGTLALHAQVGDAVHAAVLLARPESRTPIAQACATLGVQPPRFLEFTLGDVQADVASKITLVRLLRELRPDVLIVQDPEEATHHLDPDRRTAMVLYLEALSLSGRDWQIEACGNRPPHEVRSIYYMSPPHPNCVVEIGATFGLKQQALNALDYQLAFSGQVMKQRLGDDALRHVIADYDALKADDLAVGRAFFRATDLALALYHGAAGHAGAGLAEAFRHQGPLKLARLF